MPPIGAPFSSAQPEVLSAMLGDLCTTKCAMPGSLSQAAAAPAIRARNLPPGAD